MAIDYDSYVDEFEEFAKQNLAWTGAIYTAWLNPTWMVSIKLMPGFYVKEGVYDNEPLVWKPKLDGPGADPCPSPDPAA